MTNVNLTTRDAIALLKEDIRVVYDEYHNANEMKSIMADIKAEVPTAWVTRSPSTNRWTVYPK